LRILFPSLQNFKHKSYLGMFLGITAVPAILALTLTLPVVDDGPTDEGGVALPDDLEADRGREQDDFAQLDQHDDDADVMDGDRLLHRDVGEELHHLVDNGFSPLHSPLGRISHTTLRRIASSGSSDGGYSSDGEDVQEISKELLEQIREEEALDFHKGLAAVQCVLGPMFCVSILFGKRVHTGWTYAHV
jgi:sodium/potassium/calcium exchanger 6